MSMYFLIGVVALLGSLLTFFSGFGLGTLLVPVFAIFFPIDLSIALTAIVHFLNNVFKLFLIGKNSNKKIVFQFGIPALFASFAGAYLLNLIAEVKPIATYTILTGTFYITPLKLLVAALLFVFSFLEIFPNLTKLEIKDKWIPFGGLLSGFFGGISGHQGALRTAFLSKAGLHKEGFIATGVVVAVLVDVSRLSVYSEKLFHRSETIDYGLLICSTGCAFVGAFAGNKLLRKITFKTLQIIVAIMLMFFSILLSLGIV